MAKKKAGAPTGVTVTLKVTPTTGDPQTQQVTVEGPTVAQVLAERNVRPEGKNLTLNGEPADLGDEVNAGDVVGVEERPAGS